MARVKVILHTTDRAGNQSFEEEEWDLDGAVFLRRMELMVDGLALFSIPFSVHEHGALHTICRRVGDPNEDVVDEVII